MSIIIRRTTLKFESKSNGKRLLTRMTAAVALSVVLVGCASTSKTIDPAFESGYLGSAAYSRLQPISSPDDGVQIYGYKNPTVNIDKYKAVIIDPVVVYQTATQDAQGKGISEQTIYQVKQAITESLKADVAKHVKVVTKSGADVARVSIAITGAQALGDGFKPTDLIPVRAVLGLASNAAGVNSKNAVLVVEAKVNDSQSGKLLGEALYVVSGETFRLESSSVEAFQKLAEKWVQTAVRVAAGRQP
jgi:hypothetical protein